MGRPWFSPTTPAAGLAGPPPKVLVDGIEATQSVQDLSQSIALVAGKRTVVRAYLSVESSVPLMVRGELTIVGTPHTTVASVNTVNIDPAQNGQLRTKREDVRLSLNFVLPSDGTLVGSRQFKLSRVLQAASGTEVGISGTVTRTVMFQSGPPLRVRVLGIRYGNASSPTTFEPRQTDFDHIRSWLRRAYPVADVVFSSVFVASNNVWPFSADQVNAQLAAMRRMDMSSGGDERTHYFGLVFDADGAQFMRGKASGIPQTPDPSTVASGPTGSNSFGWDNDGSYGDWYTGHELGHTFGRFHPGFCNGNTPDDPSFPYPNGQLSDATGENVGFDVGDGTLGLEMRALPGVAWHDVMTYCDNQWLCPYTYEGIRLRLLAEEPLGGSPPVAGPGPAGAAMAKSGGPPGSDDGGGAINLVATVNLTRQTGHIEYVQPISRSATGSGMSKNAQTSTEARLRDDSGNILTTVPVELRLGSCPLPGEDRSGLVDAVIDLPQGNVRFIDLMLNGKILDTFAASGITPSIANLRTMAQPSAGIGLQWDAEHAPASTVTYSVQVSTDGGSSWQTIAVRQPAPHYTIDPSHFRDAKSLRTRVIATDGIQSSVVSSEDVPLAQQ